MGSPACSTARGEGACMNPGTTVCRDAPRDSGRFVTGYFYSTSTQFRRGEHRSRETEFVPGQIAHNRLPYGTVRVRRETHTGLQRAWVKVSEPNVWMKRAMIVWEALNGPLPKGWVVHHRDGNSLNDAPDNLEGLSRREHASVHRQRGEFKA